MKRQRDHQPSYLSGLRPNVRDAVSEYVRRVQALFADKVVSITLYGSQARGEASAESDIDLFIVVRDGLPDIGEALADLAWQVQLEYEVVISDLIRNEQELHTMQLNQFPYYRNVQREGIVLWKNESEPMHASA